jgi:hypothetical protein
LSFRKRDGPLLAVQELAELPGGHMLAQFRPLRRAEPLPLPGPVEGQVLLRRAQHVIGVDLQVPVDPLHAVPLLVLALLVKGKELVAAILVLP